MKAVYNKPVILSKDLLHVNSELARGCNITQIYDDWWGHKYVGASEGLDSEESWQGVYNFLWDHKSWYGEGDVPEEFINAVGYIMHQYVFVIDGYYFYFEDGPSYRSQYDQDINTYILQQYNITDKPTVDNVQEVTSIGTGTSHQYDSGYWIENGVPFNS